MRTGYVLYRALVPVCSPVKVIPGEKYRFVLNLLSLGMLTVDTTILFLYLSPGYIVKILGELSDCDSSDSESADGSLLDAYEDLLPNYSYLDEPDNENSGE